MIQFYLYLEFVYSCFHLYNPLYSKDYHMYHRKYSLSLQCRDSSSPQSKGCLIIPSKVCCHAD